MFELVAMIAMLAIVAILLRILMRLNEGITVLTEVKANLEKVLTNAGNPVLTAEQEAVVTGVKETTDKLLALFPDPPTTPPTT